MLVPQGTAPTPRFAVLGPSRGLRYGKPVAPAAGLNEHSKTRAVLLAVAEEKVKNKNKNKNIKRRKLYLLIGELNYYFDGVTLHN
jgi:hypothetical protein